MPPLLDGLNPQQLAAVTLPGQSALILAGAGSGKTRVLTTRIAWLISNGHASPSGIFAVTFTNKAAREMLARLSTMLPTMPRDMWIGTFHGLAHRLLRTHHAAAKLPRLFQILDSADQLSAIKRTLKALNIDTERFDPRKVQAFINQNKESGVRPGQSEAWDPYNRRLVDIYAAYDEQCQREGVVDFAELLLRSHELLSQNESLRLHYQERFHHVLIDEFQDTNRLQYRWLKLFAGPATTLMAVGDDDQSIYAFRGAHTGNMQEFQRDFAGDNLIRLEQNYRSQGNILDAANALISRNPERLGKELWTDAGQGEPIHVFRAEDDREEAGWLCRQVRHLQDNGHPLSDIAVLYRSNAQSRELEHSLFAAGIPYRVYGGLRFFERQEIKHALAYLRLLVNPDDDSALIRVINFPTRGIGARTLEQLSEAALADQTSLWQICLRQPAGKSAQRGVSSFTSLITRLREETRLLNVAECIADVLEHSGLNAFYRNETDGQDRLDNLAELVNAGRLFEQEANNETSADSRLADFLALASLEAGHHQADPGADALQLMTIHAAKGLEFDSVFLTGLEEGLFPSEHALTEDRGIEEERRLMYVAITRARHRLYLSLAGKRMLHGRERWGIQSRFLAEIPETLRSEIRPHKQWAPATTPAIPSAATHHRPAASSAQSSWRSGMNVRHAKFGVGVILAVAGMANDLRVQVRFTGEHGTKWLAMAYAKLEPMT